MAETHAQLAARLYAGGVTMEDVAQSFGVPLSRVRSALVEEGVTLRSRGRPPLGSTRGPTMGELATIAELGRWPARPRGRPPSEPIPPETVEAVRQAATTALVGGAKRTRTPRKRSRAELIADGVIDAAGRPLKPGLAKAERKRQAQAKRKRKQAARRVAVKTAREDAREDPRLTPRPADPTPELTREAATAIVAEYVASGRRGRKPRRVAEAMELLEREPVPEVTAGNAKDQTFTVDELMDLAWRAAEEANTPPLRDGPITRTEVLEWIAHSRAGLPLGAIADQAGRPAWVVHAKLREVDELPRLDQGGSTQAMLGKVPDLVKRDTADFQRMKQGDLTPQEQKIVDALRKLPREPLTRRRVSDKHARSLQHTKPASGRRTYQPMSARQRKMDALASGQDRRAVQAGLRAAGLLPRG